MNAKTLRIILSVLLAVLTVAVCAGCGAEPTEDAGTETSAKINTDTRPEVLSQDEYVLYQNIFYGDYGKDSDGTSVEKEGVFASVYDAYNNRRRYYVWGYYDQTKCCDWQWEFVPNDETELPAVGSLITVSGTFVSDEAALDGYWISSASVSAKTVYSGAVAECDMRSMSDTLERVQIYNITYHPEAFQDKEFTAYGRVASLSSIEDPYYDGSWQIEISWDGEIPGIGTIVEIAGTISDGKLIVRSMNEMN